MPEPTKVWCTCPVCDGQNVAALIDTDCPECDGAGGFFATLLPLADGPVVIGEEARAALHQELITWTQSAHANWRSETWNETDRLLTAIFKDEIGRAHV